MHFVILKTHFVMVGLSGSGLKDKLDIKRFSTRRTKNVDSETMRFRMYVFWKEGLFYDHNRQVERRAFGTELCH